MGKSCHERGNGQEIARVCETSATSYHYIMIDDHLVTTLPSKLAILPGDSKLMVKDFN